MYESKVAFNTHSAALSSVGPASPDIISGKGPQTDEETAKAHNATQDQPHLRGVRFQNLTALNSQFNNISRSIGTVSRTMDQIEDRVTKISDKLSAFKKIFPPYPPGSEERVKLLKSFSALRKQIQRLTFPPEDEGARSIMAPAMGQNGSQTGTGITVKGPGIDIAVHPRSLQFGPQGIDIPEMSPQVRDEEIDEILSKVAGTREALQAKRQGLHEDAEKLFGVKEQLGGINIPSVDDGSSIPPAPLREETEAEGTSQRIFGALVGQKAGIAEDPNVLKPFLG